MMGNFDPNRSGLYRDFPRDRTLAKWVLQQEGPFSPQDIATLVSDPEIRLLDHPTIVSLARQLSAKPDSEGLQQQFLMMARKVCDEVICGNDPFRANYPPKYVPLGAIHEILGIVDVPTGQTLGPRERAVCEGGLIVGPTGTGKTNLSKRQAHELVVHRGWRVIAIDQKTEFRELATVPELRDKTIVLKDRECRIAFGQPPKKGDEREWGVRACNLAGVSYGRMFAQRFLLQVFEQIRQKLRNQPNRHVTLDALISEAEQTKVRWGGTEARYRESILSVLNDIRNSFPGVFSYANSTFLETLFEPVPGLVIIETTGLSPEAYTFFVAYLIAWLYEARA